MQGKTYHLRISRVLIALMSLLGVIFLPRTGLALEERARQLIEGAKREGKMFFYASLNQQDCTVLLQKFEAKYPFIKTDLSRLNAERLLIKFLRTSAKL